MIKLQPQLFCRLDHFNTLLVVLVLFVSCQYVLLCVWVTCCAVTVSNASFSRSRRKPNQTTKCSAHSRSARVSLSAYSASLILLLQNNIHGPLRIMLLLHCCSWNSYDIVLQYERVISYIKMVLSLRILVL
jgi:hypothetical protein